MFKCTNCSWEGEELSKQGINGARLSEKCPVCGDEVSGKEKEIKKEKLSKEIKLDLNGDGKFDKKDKSIAARVLASKPKKKKGAKR